MIRIRELNPRGVHLSKEHRYNLHLLHTTVNEIRYEWGKPIIVTSGVRSLVEHMKIYEKINAQRKKEGKLPVNVPYGSKHLEAAAADLADPDGMLYHFIHSRFDY